ncbi:MAG: transcription-repair coupling factor [Clostridia bacterium]|nr:transcription-repair coupling factor [Clostridia bacterium]
MVISSPVITLDRECRQYLLALAEQLRARRPLPLVVNGLCAGAADALIAESIRAAGVPSLVLVPDEGEGATMTRMLRAAGLRVLSYQQRDLLFDFVSASHGAERERIYALDVFARGACDALVTTLPAALGYTMPRATLAAHTVGLRVGSVMPPDELAERLVGMGYVPVECVESAGQFCRRGGILDVCDASLSPLRIEFFGDEIDRMGFFDPETQRVSESCEAARLLPAREVLYDQQAAGRLLATLRRHLSGVSSPSAGKALRREIAALESGEDLYSRDKYHSFFYPERETLLSYLTAGEGRRPVFSVGSSAVREAAENVYAAERQTASVMIEDGSVPGKWAGWSADPSDFAEKTAGQPLVYVNQFSGVSVSERVGGLFGFRCRQTPAYRDNFKALCEDLSDYRRAGYRVLILCPTAAACKPLIEELRGADVAAVLCEGDGPIDTDALLPGSVRVAAGECRGGFDLPNPKVAFLTMDDDASSAAARRRLRRPKKKTAPSEALLSAAELRPGDYVVHEAYGVGQFVGLENIRVDGVSRDYIRIRYAGTDTLFVPADRLERIGKYIGAGAEDGRVKLSRMGSAEWQKTRARAKGAAKELAADLIRLYAARQNLPGFAFPPDGELERSFDEAFEFEETDPQLIAAAEIKADMERPVPMDRLLCGDVGFGKTEVAFRAAFKAICAGKQVAMLVPTTILALQHYQTALSRMRGFPVTVEMLSRFRTPAERARILRRAARGDVDLLIGTHSLLSSQVTFKDLGLLIVDEEQRFGVAQKEKLKQLARSVDVLTLTATPIPRTLHMAMSGIRDMSVLDEAPTDRFPVQTYVMEHDDGVILEAIRRELRRGGQALYLYNRVDRIATVADRLARELPDARVTWAHGQMDREELESIWQSLVRGEIDVLVCTTIIETGVDLPNANTLIIENADRMGLAQLHQLRGRVGRSGRRAYAYFTYRAGKLLSDVAAKRLQAIREFAEFGAGFRIAMRDLEIRGAGNLLGAEQHGNIDAVGYDLYVRLLREAILEEQGQTPEPPFECTVKTEGDALIPATYIASEAQRMDMYKKISHITSDEDRMDVLDEFCDRFGEPPASTLRLLWVAELRALGARLRMPQIESRGPEVRFFCERVDLSVWSELFADTAGLRMTGGRGASVTLRCGRGEDPVRAAAQLLTRYLALREKLMAESAEAPPEQTDPAG